ncbi:MAG: hypothetical protein ACE141_12150 [Bryobacteraceae bacterium]
MSRRPDVRVPPDRLLPEKSTKVLEELERVLASPHFRTSRRCQTLLRRITELSLAGDMEALKERSLGIEVFGRPADYDTSQDPVVRATAAEIRKKLAQYYLETGNQSDTRIELPSGAYHVEFHFYSAEQAATSKKARPVRGLLVVAGAAVVVLAAAVLYFSTLKEPTSELDDLWGPVLRSPGMVLVCVGLQAAYNLRSAHAQDVVQGVVQQPATVGPIRGEDLVLLRDRYVALDDALCLVRMTALLERYRKPYRIRAEKSTSFADLRDTPAVLIGAFDNPWTLRTTGQLRFTFSKDSVNDVGLVHDSQHPENSEWRLTNYWPLWDIPVDYAIVTRVVDTTTDRPVIIAAGLTQYGTLGAGELLTNPEYFSEAARKLPKNWERKNLQIVLKVPVVNRTSGRPRIIATHVW